MLWGRSAARVQRVQGHACGVRVLKMDRPDGRRVLKFDGAFGPEGCGIALTGDEYEVSVTRFAFLCHRA